jgi:uncharacterized protein (DUF305 family)
MKRTLLSAVVLAGALALAGCSGSEEPMEHDMSTMSGSESGDQAAHNEADMMFAQMMIPHHEQAIEMADLALAEATASEEVKALARDIKAAQDPEIATMTGWLDEWKAPPSVVGGMDHGTGMMSEADMETLRGAEGADFDREWLTMMVEHHEGAIEMANDVMATTTDPEVKSLAQAVVAGQQAEITTMRGLLQP